ncbi:hypothetical protein Hanom_Chr06g00515221 [Helianthus anomalus]
MFFTSLNPSNTLTSPPKLFRPQTLNLVNVENPQTLFSNSSWLAHSYSSSYHFHHPNSEETQRLSEWRRR